MGCAKSESAMPVATRGSPDSRTNMAQRPQAEELIQDCTQGINTYLTDGRAHLKAFSRQHRESVKEQEGRGSNPNRSF